MRKLAFNTIELENFKSFAGGPHLFNLDARGVGLHFVRGRNEAEPRLGPNGAGKSSLWDALCWCLYGKTPSGLRNPDVHPRQGGKQQVDVAVIINGNQTVRRSVNPNFLDLNGSPVGQEQVDQLIGLSFEAFTHTVLLGQGQPLFYDLAPRDKMQLFSDVLDLERWEQRSVLARERAHELNQAQATAEGELEAFKTSKEELQQLLADTKTKAAEWDKEQRSKRASSRDTLTEIQAAIQKGVDKISQLDSSNAGVARKLEGLREDLEQLREAAAPGKVLQSAREELAAKLDGTTEVCPTCGQAMDPNKLARQRAKMRKDLADIDEALKSVAKAQKQRTKLLEKFDEYEKQMRSVDDDISNHLKAVTELRTQEYAIKQNMEERDKQDNPHGSQLANIKKRIAKINCAIVATQDDVAKLERKAERAKFWVKGFKDVRLYVIEEVLQDLELATNAALEDVGLVGWEVKYDVEKETKAGTVQRGLNVLITSPETKQRVKWESWSGGEGQRLRLVGALALSEVLLAYAGVQPTIEILDEPAHFMAPAGIRDLTDFLAYRAQGLERSTFYVDHVSIDSSRFASVTTVVKSKEGSYLE